MLEGSRLEHEHTAPDAISAAACQVARLVGAAAIVSYTTSGCDRASRRARAACVPDPGADLEPRHRAPACGLVGRALRAHKRRKSFGDMVQKAVRIAHREKIAELGQRVVITAGSRSAPRCHKRPQDRLGGPLKSRSFEGPRVSSIISRTCFCRGNTGWTITNAFDRWRYIA